MHTNKHYITIKLTKFGLSAEEIEAIMIENGIDENGEVEVIACKTAIYNSMSSILPVADVSESDYSIKWNVEALKLWYGSLCTELGKTNVLTPKIRNRSNIW
jgi:hypothetical protein